MGKLIISLLCISIARLAFGSELAADFVHHPVELEDEANIVKRQAQGTTKPPAKGKGDDYISIKTEGGCKLYVAGITFLRRKSKEGGAQADVVEVNASRTNVKDDKYGNCGNWSGNIILNLEKLKPVKEGGPGLDKLILTFNISYLKPYGWWELSDLRVEASGPLVEEKGGFDKTFEGHVMRSVAIGASKKFSYACGQTPTLYYSMDEKQSTVYGLKFRDLQIQPFIWQRSPGNFTDNVDDCVPFFSIGIWMFLVVAAVLLLVVFFGIGMISSLKTMDRFDDPKGKPLVINTKE